MELLSSHDWHISFRLILVGVKSPSLPSLNVCVTLYPLGKNTIIL